MRVAFYPNTSRWDENPYYPLLRHALERFGVSLVNPKNDYLSTGWLLSQRKNVDVLHFHWIQYHYAPDPPNGSWVAQVKFAAKLLLARTLGYRIVWTMHNVFPHESGPRGMDMVARLAIAQLSHSILLLCEAGRDRVIKLFHRRSNIFVTGHGPYTESNHSNPTKAQARKSLGLEERHLVFITFGNIRRYKGLERILANFTRVGKDHWRLLIAGRPLYDELHEQMSRWTERDKRIHVYLGYVPPKEFEGLLRTADVATFAFENILSSGSVIKAMSAGLPVIAPAIGCIPEVVPPDCGILYDAKQPDGLAEAMERAGEINLEAMGRMARGRVTDLSWDEVANATLKGYGVGDR